MAYVDVVREIVLQFPGMVEGLTHGSTAFKTPKKLLAVMMDDGVTVVVQVGQLEQGFLIENQPDIYYITDHYRGTPFLRVRLENIERDGLEIMLETAWRRLALKRDIAAFDASRKTDS